MQQTPQQDTTNKYDWLVLNTIQLMRDAKAAQQSEQYWTHFEFAAQLLIPYIDIEIRKRMDVDFQHLTEGIDKIKKEQKSEITRKNMINELRDEFADNHRSFFMPALSRIGITRVTEEGIIKFDKLDIDQLAAIIRDTRSGTVQAVEKQLDKMDTTTGDAAVGGGSPVKEATHENTKPDGQQQV